MPDFEVAWPEKPTTRYFFERDEDEQGRPESAYLELRAAKARRVEQPDKHRLIFLHLGADGFPVGVKMFEPVPGTIKAFILQRLIRVTNGEPNPIAPYVFGPCAPDAFVDAVIRDMERVGEVLAGAKHPAIPSS